MTERELREIKRRFRPEKSNIPRIVGCFVNENGQIISKISQSLPLGDSVVSEKLLSVMKKTLSGGMGTNLTDIEFTTNQVSDSEEHALLMGLLKSKLGDDELLEKFYTRARESVKFESNYVILLANDTYDVFKKSEDGTDSESSEVFSYIVAAICPVKNMPETLSFKEADSLFHAISPSALLSSPELGFMFPCFDGRTTNIYNALYYTRSIAENYPDFMRNVFAAEAKMPPKEQKAVFGDCLSSALGEDCSYELVRSVHAEMAEMVEAHKESRDPEPLVITKETVKTMIANCGVDEEKIAELETKLDESFGKGAEITPKNILTTNKFEVATPEVSIKIDPAHRDLVSTQVINNVKYVMIRVTGETTVNGISINIDGNE